MSVIQAGNTTTTSLIYTGDTSGNLVFTTGGANTVALSLSNAQVATFANNVSISGALTVSGNTVATTAQLPTANTICRAWCNYNGGTQTIVNSYNISSVTYNGTGDYTFNYTNALPNANNAVVCTGSGDGGPATPNLYGATGTNTTTGVRVYGNSVNHFANCIIVFG